MAAHCHQVKHSNGTDCTSLDDSGETGMPFLTPGKSLGNFLKARHIS